MLSPRTPLKISSMFILLAAAGCVDAPDGRQPADTGGIHVNFDPPQDGDGDASSFDPGTYFAGIDAEFINAGKEFGVPAQILQAVAYTETQWQMIEGEAEFDGQDPAYGVMGLRGEALGIGASMAGIDAATAKSNRAENVRAGAALLSAYADELAVDRSDLGAWAVAVARYSGIAAVEVQAEYVHNGVYATLRSGVEVVDYDGEPVATLEPMADLQAKFDKPPVLPVQGADYAKAIFRASPNYSSRPAGTAGKPTFVIIHSCEGAYSGCWGWLKNKDSGVSAHYVVKEDGGEITQLVPEAKKAWHIAAGYKCALNNKVECGREGASSNNFTVGIEHAGFAKQAAWSSGIISESAKLVCDISKRQGIARDKYHVVGHGQLQPYNRIDPGPNWPWATYLQKVNEACGQMPEPEPEPMPEPEPEPEPLPEPEPEPMPEPEPEPPAGEIVIDNNNANNNAALAKFEASANWTAAASTPGYHGTNYAYAATEAVSDAAYFSFYLDAPATRTIDVWYTAGTNRSPTAPYVVFDAQGNNLGTVKVDMSKTGSQWVELGTFNFTAGWNKIGLSRWTSTGKVVVADGVRARAN